MWRSYKIDNTLLPVYEYDSGDIVETLERLLEKQDEIIDKINKLNNNEK